MSKLVGVATVAAAFVGAGAVALGQDGRVGEPVVIAPATGAGQPAVAVSADGASVWVVYGGMGEGQGNVYVVRSSDGGTTFGAPSTAIDAGGRGRFGAQRGPQIGVHEAGRVTVSAAVQLEAIDPAPKYPQADLWLAVSEDGGATFGTPVRVNDGGKTAAESMHALAVGADGVAHLVWLDSRGGQGNQLWHARVTRQGTVVERNRLAYGSPDGGICPCCPPGLVVDAKGNPVAAFRNMLGGNRDGWIALSRNKGRTFAAAKVGRGSWPGTS